MKTLLGLVMFEPTVVAGSTIAKMSAQGVLPDGAAQVPVFGVSS